ncbi:MAG: DUF2851 family protein, partial [Ktedonobacteraceae bacterium]|nr:DUF2851 family protein [Ktedonobacteraceae bacterium]
MSATLPLEDEVARRWWSLSPGCILPLSDGSRYQLLFAGRPGGSCGPDVRDAVLCHAFDAGGRYVPGTDRLVGDVEFHVRAGDWLAHRHHTDARYNRVILHIVLRYDDRHTPRQDGQPVPICSLYDLPLSAFADWRDTSQALWPCQSVMADVTARQCLLRSAGLARFELKAQSFVAQLHTLGEQFPGIQAEPYNLVLIPALAEGLGYGRDRDFFRATGLFLLGLTEQLPRPLGHGLQPEPLDARRLRVLRTMVYEWRDAWKVLRSHLLAEEEHRCLQALRDAF